MDTLESPQLVRAVIPPIDYQTLDYVGPVDESLVCAICMSPFVQPVTTICGHTFCRACILRSTEETQVCPIDRKPLFLPEGICIVIADQVDRLEVKCPRFSFGCTHTTTRDRIATHYGQCGYMPVRCPDTSCELMSRKNMLAKGCLHRPVRCEYCDKQVLEIDLEKHLDEVCKDHKIDCSHCGQSVAKHRLQSHRESECPECEVKCRWANDGCTFTGRKRLIKKHERGCVFEHFARFKKMHMQTSEMQNLAQKAEIQNLQQSLQEVREELCELKYWRRDTHRLSPSTSSTRGQGHARAHPTHASYYPASSSTPSPTSGSILNPISSWESPDEYVLGQFEHIAGTIEDLRRMQTEIDGRHSMMLLNETMPIKEQVAELRSTLGVVNMHTTWLMNQARQNRGQQRAGVGSALASVAAAASDTASTAASSAVNANGGSSSATVSSAASSRTQSVDCDACLPMPRVQRHVGDGRGDHPPRL